jgi:hypothetical protein
MYCPFQKVEKLIQFVRQNISSYTSPIWLCPVLQAPQPFSPNGMNSFKSSNAGTILVDVGIYGRLIDNLGHVYTRHLDIWAMKNDARKMVSAKLKA